MGAGGTAVAASPASAPGPEEVRIVHGWLSRISADPTESERLLVEILRRSRGGTPAFLRGASPTTRLQFLTVQSVLRMRGVL